MTITNKSKTIPSSSQNPRYEYEIAKYLESKSKFICRKLNRHLYLWELNKFIDVEESIEDLITITIEERFPDVSPSTHIINKVKRVLKSHHQEREYIYNNEIINCENGYLIKYGSEWSFISHIINIEDWESYEPPQVYNCLPVQYNNECECLIIDKMFEDLVGFENVGLLYKMFAYFLMNSIKYQKAFLLYGPPATGKTTFINLIIKFFGRKLISQVRLQDLSKNFKLSNCIDRFINLFDDLDNDSIKRIDRFKQLVTNPYLTASMKYVTFDVEFMNRIKLLFACNTLPEIPPGTGDDFFRRWIIIPCFNIHNYEDMDLTLLEKINNNELSGLLNKILLYMGRLESEGFGSEWNQYEYVRAKWEIDINPIRLFIEECCELGPSYKTEYNKVYHSLNQFRAEHDAKPVSKNMCTRSLAELGVLRSSNRKYYKGIKLLCCDNTNKLL